MIPCLMVFFTVFAAPPEGVDPDDLDHWEALSKRAAEGPKGCWVFTGSLQITTTFETKATLFRRAETTPRLQKGTFEGRLEDGHWTQFDYHLSKPEGVVRIGTTIQPVIGAMPPGVSKDLDAEPEADEAEPSSSAEATNILRRSLDSWKTYTGISHAQWREDLAMIELIQEVPVDESANAKVVQMTTVFPNGGELPSRISVRFPKHLTSGSWPTKVHIYDGQIHLLQRQVEGVVLPAVEKLSAVGSFLGFTMGYEQQITYQTASPCR